MNAFLIVFAIFLGLAVGSFANVVIFRTHQNKSFGGFSACPHCRHRLEALDLVPVFSFLFLRGKCRWCKKSISWQYPLVEAAAAAIFLLIIGYSVPLTPGLFGAGSFWWWLIQFVIASCLLAVFVFDLRYYLIPDSFVAFGLVASVFYRYIFKLSFADGLWGIVAVAGFFLLLYLFSRGKWIGLGDVKLGVFLGFFLGLKLSLAMLMLSYCAGAAIGVALVLLGRKTIKGTLPFGTFLTAAALVVMLWGERMVGWYLGLFYY